MILITGGSGSGKSFYAETETMRIAGNGARYYFAAMKPYGEEALKRIQRHRLLRSEKGFITCETYTGIDLFAHRILPQKAVVLLECVPNLLANEMFDETFRTLPVAEAVSRVITEICETDKMAEQLLVITNDIFSDGVQYEPATEHYVKALSQINMALAEHAEQVVEVQSGIPFVLKGEEISTKITKETEKRGAVELYIGGRGQGKLDCVLKSHPELSMRDVYNCTEEMDFGGYPYPVLYRLQELFRIQSRIQDTSSAYEHLTRNILNYLEQNPKTIVIADEVGSGVIPAKPSEIHFREASGRALCRIAKQASCVTRLVCGIPQQLKGYSNETDR